MAKLGISTLGRKELLHWVNQLLGPAYDRIEELSNGAAFCQIIDAIHPGTVHMRRVNFTAVTESEMAENYKILEDAFSKNRIRRPLDVPSLLKGKYLETFEMCAWIHSRFEQKFMGSVCEYDGPGRRRASKSKDVKGSASPPGAEDAAEPATAPNYTVDAVRQPGPMRTATANSSPKAHSRSAVAPGSDRGEVKKLRNLVAKLEEDVEQRAQERDFYYAKLRKVEELCQDYDYDDEESPVHEILDILYEPDEEHGFFPPDDAV
jgi:RP/EB family microtubule-associated protein